MKRLSVLLIIPLLLSGCGGIHENYRDVENLLVTETLGIDYIPGGVRVSCASSMGSSEQVSLSGVGQSIEEALENIQARDLSRRLFCRHTEHIIIGEAAARHGMEDILEYICRSPEMRIDTPVYILRGSEVHRLIRDTDGISRVMAGASDFSDTAPTATAADITGDMLHRSASLVSVLERSRSSDEPDGTTVAVSGCAVIKNYRLCAFLSESETLGASFLTDRVKGGTLTVSDSRTGTVTLKMNEGGSDIYPILSDTGEPVGLAVDAHLRATVAEIDGGVAAGSAVYMRQLTGLAEESVSEKISSVLRLSASLGADFLGLGESLSAAAPEAFGGDIGSLLPGLEIQVKVSAVLSHTNDMRDEV